MEIQSSPFFFPRKRDPSLISPFEWVADGRRRPPRRPPARRARALRPRAAEYELFSARTNGASKLRPPHPNHLEHRASKRFLEKHVFKKQQNNKTTLPFKNNTCLTLGTKLSTFLYDVPLFIIYIYVTGLPHRDLLHARALNGPITHHITTEALLRLSIP